MNDPWIFQSLEVHFVLYLYVLIMMSHDTSACFFSFIKLISLQNAHMSFSIDGYGLDVGGWVWVRTGISHQCYVLSCFVSSSSCCHLCLSALRPLMQALSLGALWCMRPMKCLRALQSLPFFKAWQPHLLQMWFPVLQIHMIIYGHSSWHGNHIANVIPSLNTHVHLYIHALHMHHQ